ncbi:MAG: Xaa-Pro peptidase family protein [Candidatus Bathyarchaeota archaeon]|jgi:Xaa-Pro aminopeptidase
MEELREKINEAIEDSGLDAWLAFGADNFRYLSGIILPFAEYYPERRFALILPKNGTPTIMCPVDWYQAVVNQGWKGEVFTYDENKKAEGGAFVRALGDALDSLNLVAGTLGLDSSRVTVSLTRSLPWALPWAEWESVDTILRGIRIMKTPSEIDRIEKACIHGDRGIVYALMHLEGTLPEPGYTVAEFTERIRVHVNENGSSGVAHLNASFGEDARILYSPNRGKVREGLIFRMDVSNHYMGYWSNLGRMGVTGEPTPKQEEAYQKNLDLKEVALDMIKPGIACSEIFSQVVETAAKEGIDIWKEPGIGHGVGVNHHEPPYLIRGYEEPINEGMVIALDIYTYGPDRELIHNKDIYEVIEEGLRRLSWYRSWDRLYAVTGFRATH